MIRDTCAGYDPRTRPWYIAATSGPKDVVLLVDVSGSMEINGRMELAKEAALAVLDTLTMNDYVQVVKFSNTATSYGTALLQGTAANRALLANFVTNMAPSGDSNYELGLSLAFDILNGTISSRCSKALLFLTDGDPGAGTPNEAELLDLVQTKNTGAVIFAYTLGNATAGGPNIPKSLACSTDGTWTPVQDGGDLRSKMIAYYEYFELRQRPANVSQASKIVWVEPYEVSSYLTNSPGCIRCWRANHCFSGPVERTRGERPLGWRARC